MPTFTLAQLQDRVYDGLDWNDQLYSRPNVRSVINEAICRLNHLVAFAQTTVPVAGATVANQLIYQTPAEISIPLRVYYEEAELSKASLRQIAGRFRTWSTDNSHTRGPVARWAPIDIRQFVIHPMCATGGQLLEVNGVAKHVDLVEPDDVISFDDQYADAAIDYAKSRIRLKEGGQAFALASLGYQEWMRKVKQWNVWNGVAFPRYYLIQQEEPSEGKAAG